MNKVLSCLIFVGGMLIAAVFYLSLGWSENFDAEHRTGFLIAVAVLIPLTLFISIRLWKKPN